MERGRDAGALLPLGERVGPLKVGKWSPLQTPTLGERLELGMDQHYSPN